MKLTKPTNKIVVYLPAVDIVRARNFYENVLGLKDCVGIVMGKEKQWVEYDLPQGGCIALTNMTKEEPQSSGCTLAFEVEDLDEMLKTLKENKTKLCDDLIDTPVCRMQKIIDTEGNGLMLHQKKHQHKEDKKE